VCQGDGGNFSKELDRLQRPNNGSVMPTRAREHKNHLQERESDAADEGLISAAFEIAERRAVALGEIKGLLLSGDNDRALSLMRKFLGIDAKGSQAGR
jgi:hypothetical protein